MEAFWKLYATGGMSKVSITKVCQIAGYNRSTFYAYFKDVYDILDTIEGLLVLFELLSPYLPVLLGPTGDPLFRKKLVLHLKPLLHKVLPNSSYSADQLDYIFEYQNAAVISMISMWYENNKNIPKEDLINLLVQLTKHGFVNTITL